MGNRAKNIGTRERDGEGATTGVPARFALLVDFFRPIPHEGAWSQLAICTFPSPLRLPISQDENIEKIF